jgi:hypothetical protein
MMRANRYALAAALGYFPVLSRKRRHTRLCIGITLNAEGSLRSVHPPIS